MIIMEYVTIQTPYIKLDQFLKLAGAASTGGEAKIMIMDGQIKINGVISRERGKKLHKDDVIEVNGNKHYQII